MRRTSTSLPSFSLIVFGYRAVVGLFIDPLLLLQMKRNVGNHYDALSKKERAFDDPGSLVVQQVMPPPGRHDLRQDNRDLSVRVLALHAMDILDKRRDD